MSAVDVTDAVYETVALVAKRERQELNGDMKIAEDLGLKSMSRIELAALLEETLDVKINNFEIRNPKTITDLIALVNKKKA
ncbi:MAG: acyl carrier protein [Anaerolineae bacterium]|nr:acyl carrier protein [Anaerolineae bacterium]